MSVQTVKNRPVVYGLTGGIASGKSTAVNFFKEKGVKIFDSDQYVKMLWDTNKELVNEVNSKYNIKMPSREGKKALANIIYNSDIDKAYINSLVHPLVFAGVDKFVEENIGEKFLIVDVPLLFETGFDQKVDKTILIYTSKKHQVNRLMKRDNLDKEEAVKRINSQITLKDKKNLSTFVINNTKTIDKLNDKLKLLYEVINR